VVVEKISEENKNIELLKCIAKLERIVGKKQLELDYYKTTVEKLSEEAGEDLEKKITNPSHNGFANTRVWYGVDM